jgi:hypothetical protein
VNEFEKFVKDHKNEMVLCCHEVFKLTGYHSDENDNYFIAMSLQTGETYLSCSIPVYALKGRLPEEEYTEVEKVFNINIVTVLENQVIEVI